MELEGTAVNSWKIDLWPSMPRFLLPPLSASTSKRAFHFQEPLLSAAPYSNIASPDVRSISHSPDPALALGLVQFLHGFIVYI